jgi:hypothetical protein
VAEPLLLCMQPPGRQREGAGHGEEIDQQRRAECDGRSA